MESNDEPRKGWEKFDEVSLKDVQISIIDESAKNEEPKDEKSPEEKPKVKNVDELKKKSDSPEEIQDPLRIPKLDLALDEEIESGSSEPTKAPSSSKYEPRTAPVAPVPCMPIAKAEKPRVLLDVNHLENGTHRWDRASVISDPKNANARILATVYPDNIVCDWVTPPHYDVVSMPSILTIDVPALPADDYMSCIKAIVFDKRFKLFSTIYSRIIAMWMTFWIFALTVTLLLQSKGGWPVMIWCLIWTVLLFAGIYACAMIRRRIRIGLNRTVANANKFIVSRHFLAAVEDRGQLSCHKVVIHFIRYNVLECTADVIKQLKIANSGGCVFGGGAPQEDPNDESIEREAAALILQYSQEYVKSVVKKRLIFPSKPIHGVSNYAPKHCKAQMCLCQFIDERHFNPKPKKWYAKYI